MTQLEERPLNQEKKNSRCGVDKNLDAKKRGRRGEIDVVTVAELFDPVNDEFLNKIGAICDAGDKSGAGNRNSTDWEPRTDRANKKRSHANGDQRKLPDTCSDGEGVGFAEIQRVRD